jgi:hypothetical protein
MAMVSEAAGYRLGLDRVKRATFLPAMIASVHCQVEPLTAELRSLIDSGEPSAVAVANTLY